MYENPYLQNCRPVQPNPGIQWVQGKEGAKAYPLQANSNAVLMDSENEGIFYIKTSDPIGMCKLRIFKFVEIMEQDTKINPDEYVKKAELKALIEEMLGGGDNGKQPVSTAQ